MGGRFDWGPSWNLVVQKGAEPSLQPLRKLVVLAAAPLALTPCSHFVRKLQP